MKIGVPLRKGVVSQTIIHAGLAVGMFMTLLPFFWMVTTALKNEGAVYAVPPELIPMHPTMQNFVRLFRELDFFTYFKNSVFVSVAYTLGACLITSMSGYVFAKLPFRGRSVIFAIVLSTAMIPRAMTLIPNYITLKYLHWLNSYQGLIIPGLANVFNIFFLRQYMQTIPDELLEAARIDGATEFRIFFSIILQLAKPALFTLAILNFIGVWNDYLWPAIVVTDQTKQTLEVGLYTLFGQNSSTLIGSVMAGATITLIPLIAVFLIGQRYIVKGISMTGMKM